MKNALDLKKSTSAIADILLMAAFIAAIASLLIRQFNESDIWWQIAIGKDILRDMAIPTTDKYSLLGWGRAYHDSHWLFQVLVGFVEGFGGLNAVGLVPAIIWSVTLSVCYRTVRTWVGPAPASILTGIVALGCSYRFIPRPDIITTLMIAVFYLLLQQGKYQDKKQVSWLAILQVIWSNSHGLFVIGPFMAGCYLAEAVWNRLRRKTVQVVPILRLTVVLLLATLCTPFGPAGWRYALQLAHEAGPRAQVIFKELAELAPVFSAATISTPDFWGLVFLLVPLSVAMTVMLAQQTVPLARCLLCIALFCAAITGRRNIPLFCLAAAPLLAEMLHLLKCSIPLTKGARLFTASLFAAFTWFAVSGDFYETFDYSPIRFGVGSPADSMPTGLPPLLKQINFTGQIYNNDRFGGFCLYHGYLPLVDGRWEIYDVETLTSILKAPYDPFQWDIIVNRYGITGALLENGMPETQALIARFIQEDSFRLVYGDNVCSFWVRNR